MHDNVHTYKRARRQCTYLQESQATMYILTREPGDNVHTYKTARRQCTYLQDSQATMYILTREPGGIGPVLTALVAGGRRG